MSGCLRLIDRQVMESTNLYKQRNPAKRKYPTNSIVYYIYKKNINSLHASCMNLVVNTFSRYVHLQVKLTEDTKLTLTTPANARTDEAVQKVLTSN